MRKNKYYAGPKDVYPLIDKYIMAEEYDYIYVAVRLGDLSKSSETLVNDWDRPRFYGIRSNRIF